MRPKLEKRKDEYIAIALALGTHTKVTWVIPDQNLKAGSDIIMIIMIIDSKYGIIKVFYNRISKLYIIY